MSNVREVSKFEEGIYQLEITDPIMGGVDGVSNVQATQLASRTRFLKDIFDVEHGEDGRHTALYLLENLYNAITNNEIAENADIDESKIAMRFVGNTRPGGVDTYVHTKELADDISRITRMNSLSDIILNVSTLESMADAFLQCYGSSGSIATGEEEHEGMIPIKPHAEHSGGLFAPTKPCPKSMASKIYIGDYMRWSVRGYILHPTSGVTVDFPAPRTLEEILIAGPSFIIYPRTDVLYVSVILTNLTDTDIFFDRGDTSSSPRSWADLSETEQREVGTSIENNIYTGSDYCIHQVQYTLKTVRNCNTLRDYGFQSIGEDSGLFYKGRELAIPLLRVVRRNGGAYHPDYNPNGAGLFYTETVANLHNWWEIEARALMLEAGAPQYLIMEVHSSSVLENNYISINSNVLEHFRRGWEIKIIDSDSNNGEYVIAKAEYRDSVNLTDVYLLSALPSSVVDGKALCLQQYRISQCFKCLGEGYGYTNSGLVYSEACGIVPENKEWATDSNLLFADFIDIDSITDLRVHLRAFERISVPTTIETPIVSIAENIKEEFQLFEFSVTNFSVDYKYEAKAEWPDGKDAGAVTLIAENSYTWTAPSVLEDSRALIRVRALSRNADGGISEWSSNEAFITNQLIEQPIIELDRKTYYSEEKALIKIKNYSSNNNYLFSFRDSTNQTAGAPSPTASPKFFTLDLPMVSVTGYYLLACKAVLGADTSQDSEISYKGITVKKLELEEEEEAIIFDSSEFPEGMGDLQKRKNVVCTITEKQISGASDWGSVRVEAECSGASFSVQEESTSTTLTIGTKYSTFDLHRVHTDKGSSTINNIMPAGRFAIHRKPQKKFSQVFRGMVRGIPVFKQIGHKILAFVGGSIYETTLGGGRELNLLNWEYLGSYPDFSTEKPCIEVILDFLYVFTQTKVYRAHIEPDFTLTNFASAPGTILDRAGKVSVVVGTRVFLLGGVSRGVYTDTIQYANILTDGKLSTWNSTGYSLPMAMSHASVSLTKNRLSLLNFTTAEGASDVVVYSGITNGELNPVFYTLSGILPNKNSSHAFTKGSLFTISTGAYLIGKDTAGNGLCLVGEVDSEGSITSSTVFNQVAGINAPKLSTEGSCLIVGSYVYWYGMEQVYRLKLATSAYVSPINDPSPLVKEMYKFHCELDKPLAGTPSVCASEMQLYIGYTNSGVVHKMEIDPSSSTEFVIGHFSEDNLVNVGDPIIRNGIKETVRAVFTTETDGKFRYKITMDHGAVAREVYLFKDFLELDMSKASWEYSSLSGTFVCSSEEVVIPDGGSRSLVNALILTEGTYLKEIVMYATREAS